MKTFAWIQLALLSSFSVACGVIAANGANGTNGQNGDSDAAADGGVGGEAGSAMGSSSGDCTISVDGTDVVLPTGGSRASASLDPRGMYLGCVLATTDSMTSRGFYVYVPDVTGAGTYDALNGSYSTYGYDEGVSSYESYYDLNGVGCKVTIDAFAPTQKGGMSARFDCSELVAQVHGTISVRVKGTITLRGREGTDAGPPPDAATYVNDAGKPSCEMDITGAYNAHAVGYGDNYACTTTGNDGDGYGFATYAGSTEPLTIDRSWCPTCTLAFSGNCITNVELDEGIGGRYVSSFTCENLIGADGSKVRLTGRVDGIHHRPPD